MVAFALYRLPYAKEYTKLVQHKGELEELFSYTKLNGKQGFVMAPFNVSPNEPILLMHPDEEVHYPIGLESGITMNRLTIKEIEQNLSNRERYAIDFANFHTHIERGEFIKIVLARSKEIAIEKEISPETLFLNACERYPRLFIALVSMPKCGTWLIATPEVLLEGNGDQWHTMALAGTMKLKKDQLDFDIPFGDISRSIFWARKDIMEQRYVADYITEVIERFTFDYNEEGPYTCRAGNLVHLRSDFNFTLKGKGQLGSLLNELHPTPAVCGLPKEGVRQFILQNESRPRRYYSGFAGMLNPEGSTHIFVSLRCMEIKGNHYILHAGGGLLLDSKEEQEWEETEAKMETILQVIENRQ